MNGAKPLLPYMPSGRRQENLHLFTDLYLQIINKMTLICIKSVRKLNKIFANY